MRPRSADILEATIREFIDSGEPISSSLLYDRYDFGIKPATIRIELTNLEGDGYLEQPHHSAGRVPSDRGYSFFAHRALENAQSGRVSRHIHRSLTDHAWENLAAQIAKELGAFGFVADTDSGHSYREGIASLVEQLDRVSHEELAGAIRDVEALERHLDVLTRSSLPQVFIGRSPLHRSRSLATFAATYEINGRPVTIVTVSPKRMDYGKAAGLFNALNRFVA